PLLIHDHLPHLQLHSFPTRALPISRKGTDITVSDLFFNTPARLKYMKTIHTELGHITDLLNRLALAHPEIRFEVTHNNKLIFKTDRKSTRLNSSHVSISYAVFCLKK